MLPLILLVFCGFIEAFAPISEGLANPNNSSLLWGPYRPNLYLGIRPRIPNSLLMGLMWSNAEDATDVTKNLRHTCEQDEGMAGYGWTAYDVRKGGVQVVNDTRNELDLITSFAKVPADENGGQWGLRVRVVPKSNAPDHQKTTTIFYLGSEDPNSRIECTGGSKGQPSTSNVVCDGTMVALPKFRIQIPGQRADSSSDQKTSLKSLTVPADSIWRAKSIFTNQLQDSNSDEGMIADSPGEGNLHFVQKSFVGAFEFDILFAPDSSSDTMTSDKLTKNIQEALSTFDKRFRSVCPPQAPFLEEQHIKMSQHLLSNLVGGMGYFYGTSKVDVSSVPESPKTNQNLREEVAPAESRAVVEEQGPYQLFSAVPSRPFFPRGFLWDEGFHLQAILDWDLDLALEIVSSWFDLMDENGWIAREQILGPEARSKVPAEFQTQFRHYANPPTLFLIFQALVARISGELPYAGAPSWYLGDPAEGKAFVQALYPKLKRHYEWFRRTQAGDLTHYRVSDSSFKQGYRWRGRTPQHILTSGLDDYPRAPSPHAEELHVDALCWVGSMAMALGNISAFLGEDEDQKLFSLHESEVIRSVDGIHWSENDRAYCDTTIVGGNRVERVCHKGYISLFPFLVGLIGPHHARLGALLDLIQDPEELWSPYGLRSLSTKDKYYGSGENYWRSPVWININYMMVQRLLEIASQPGPHQERGREMYTELRLNLVNTVLTSWKETGFAWEQYNPETGKGQRTQHFTGWTSLIVKIMAMPDVQPGSPPQNPGYIKMPTKTDGWDLTLTLLVVGMLFICVMLRRRLMRVWRALMET